MMIGIPPAPLRALTKILFSACLLLSLAVAQAPTTPQYTFKVIHSFHHDDSAFTQGLVYHDGFLYEGTGLEGKSTLRKVKLETGEVLQRIDLSPLLFGEGIAIFHDQVFQLTWRSQVGFVWDLKTFREQREFSYPGEGWGLTSNDRELFLSDGTDTIRILDPQTLTEKRRITVRDGNDSVTQLNELEWVEGELYANVWQTNRIARISPQSGKVLGWIDLTGLMSPMYHLQEGAVLNGIAYDSIGKRLFVTGKLWPMLFEIRLVRKPK